MNIVYVSSSTSAGLRLLRKLAVTAAIALVALLLAWHTAPATGASATSGTVAWPVPLPHWFWGWARWYLGRDEFAGQPPRDATTRPASAPTLIPEWAWRRLIVLTGGTPPPLPETTLRSGDRGDAVEALQRALRAARYVAGPIDGRFGRKTQDAVIAWEKVNASRRDGAVSPEEYPRIIRSLPPRHHSPPPKITTTSTLIAKS